MNEINYLKKEYEERKAHLQAIFKRRKTTLLTEKDYIELKAWLYAKEKELDKWLDEELLKL